MVIKEVSNECSVYIRMKEKMLSIGDKASLRCPYGGGLHMMAWRTFVCCMHCACRDDVPHRLAGVVLWQ